MFLLTFDRGPETVRQSFRPGDVTAFAVGSAYSIKLPTMAMYTRVHVSRNRTVPWTIGGRASMFYRLTGTGYKIYVLLLLVDVQTILFVSPPSPFCHVRRHEDTQIERPPARVRPPRATPSHKQHTQF